MRRFYTPVLSCLIAVITIVGCTHDPDPVEEEEVSIFSLAYGSDTVKISEGDSLDVAPTTLNGTFPANFFLDTDPATTSSTMSISDSGKVSIHSALGDGIYDVTVIVTNEDGSFSFPDAFVVQVDSIPDTTATVKISFAADIQPVIQTKCTPCHVSGGSQTPYYMYDNASAGATTMRTRINTDQGQPGAMPLGGPKLDQEFLDLFDQWINDGLQP